MAPDSSFQSPEFGDLVDFYKCIQNDVPEQHNGTLNEISKKSMEKIYDPNVLHVWESDSDLDNLLQLGAVITKVCGLGMERQEQRKDENKKYDGMIIIAEDKAERDNFNRLCELVQYLSGVEGQSHLENTVCAFNSVVVVRGVNNFRPDGGRDWDQAVRRINVVINRVKSSSRKIIWHHGPVIGFLIQWINTTSPSIRSSLSAITITSALDLTKGVQPSSFGRKNTIRDLHRLEEYARKLGIEVVFLDSESQLITSEYLATYMYFFAYYINTLLPNTLSRPHLYNAQDELVTFAFRLRGASEGKYGEQVVTMVKEHLDAQKARIWARTCIDASSYTKEKCRETSKDAYIHHAVQLADSPFSPFTHGSRLPAFSRLALGPASLSPSSYFLCPPVSFTYTSLPPTFRVSHPSPFRLLLPAPGQDVERVTGRIQGLMMAVLERVRQEKGNPMISNGERVMWKTTMKACLWAMNGCEEEKIPKGVKEKIGFIKKKLKHGTWSFTLGIPKENRKK